MPLEKTLAAVLSDNSRFGQILIQSKGSGGFVLCHRDDENSCGLEIFKKPEDALRIARSDDAGKYRPLKTAPNLRHGWRLEVVDLGELQRALDCFYPGRLACKSDGGCLRTILWKRDTHGAIPSTSLPPKKFDPGHDQTGRGQNAIPLLCQEPCNLLVAECRKAVKGEVDE